MLTHAPAQNWKNVGAQLFCLQCLNPDPELFVLSFGSYGKINLIFVIKKHATQPKIINIFKLITDISDSKTYHFCFPLLNPTAVQESLNFE